jgi:UDP-N-acetylglucosamine 1-carboxyvinyltransferase
MDIFHIEGPVRLSGTVGINGSKNASLPIMAAALLAGGKSVVKSLPRLSDISLFCQLLRKLGCKYLHTGAAACAVRDGGGVHARGMRHWGQAD